MGQHLYECSACHCHGAAHYILKDGALVRLCTGCWTEWKKAGGRDTQEAA